VDRPILAAVSVPSASICIPTWNGAAFLSTALQSALAQTYSDFELLLVDDASTDTTLDVAGAFPDPRLRIHRNDRRLGIPGNWNHCLELARGTYVKFLFQDDVLDRRALAKLVAALEAVPAASFAFSRREIRHEGPDIADLPLLGARYSDVVSAFYATLRGPFDGIDLVRQGLQTGRDLAVNVVGEPSFVLLRREAVIRAGGFDSSFAQLVDWEMWLRLARDSPVVFVDESLGVFRVHAGGQSASNHRRLRTLAECVRLLGRLQRHYGSRLSRSARGRLVLAQCRYAAHLVGELTRSIRRGRARPALD
jgi:glycosyltransferase involved in cell wall biosynthesis